MLRLWVLLFAWLVCVPLLSASVRINEVMASNGITLADEDGDYEDWIELINRSASAVSLSGWALSDDSGNIRRWIFPSVEIGPSGRLLVWASGKDRREVDGPMHTNFSISSEGEPIYLVRPDGSVADHLPARPIPRDVSYGRSPDGGESWAYFIEVTPGGPNGFSPFTTVLEAPRLSHGAGVHVNPIGVEASSIDTGVTLRYTVDGSTPTEESPVFPEVLAVEDRTQEMEVFARIPSGAGFQAPQRRISKATVVRVRAFRDNAIPSETETATYWIGEQFINRWPHPVISISVDYDDFWGEERGIYVHGPDPEEPNFRERGIEWERVVHFEFFETDGTRVLSHPVGARIHGASSRNYAKKSLRLYARAGYGAGSFEHAIFPDQPYSSYRRLILRNSGNDRDRTLLRDGFMQTLVGHMRMDTQAYRPSILFINGEYWGIHNIRERYDRHYLERVYGIDPDNLDILSNWVFEPEGDRNHFNALISYMRTNDPRGSSFLAEVERRMDVDNFIDYNVAQIYLNNQDWPGNNYDHWRLRVPFVPDASPGHDGRWRWLLYDTDFGYNFVRNQGVRNENYNTLIMATEPGRTSWPNPDWSTRPLRLMLQNESFRDSFVNRMADQLNTGFNSRRALELFEEQWDRIWPNYPLNRQHPEQPEIGQFEEITRWPMILRNRMPNEWNVMRLFARKRPDAVFRHISEYFHFEPPYKLTVDVHPAGTGSIQINTVEINSQTFGLEDRLNPFPWSGRYYHRVPVTVTAVPAPGYVFEGWEGLETSEPSLTFNGEGDIFLRAVFSPSDEPPAIIPHRLREGGYIFSSWEPDRPEGAFPPHMLFLQSEQDDPTIRDAVDIPYSVTGDYHGDDTAGFPYNNTRRTRINGLGERGISFINTGRGRDLGAAVLALDTRDCYHATVQWEASTEEANSRVYAIRFQYRVGGSAAEFIDFPHPAGGVVEYRRSEQEGVTEQIGPYPLPEAALGQAYVELRWKYYFTGKRLSSESGARDEIRLDNIHVQKEAASYALWKHRNFSHPLDRSNAEVSGAMADPVGDGLSNLLRYALDIGLTGRGNERLPRIEASPEGRRVVWSVREPKPDLRYMMESSSDLRSWTQQWEHSGSELSANQELTLPVEGADAYWRLRVEFQD